MWEDNRAARKQSVLDSLLKGVLLHCECSNEIDVNKPLLPK